MQCCSLFTALCACVLHSHRIACARLAVPPDAARGTPTSTWSTNILLIDWIPLVFVRRCVLDTKPRDFSADSTTLLTQLANMVMREVERKRAMNDALCSAAVRHTRWAAWLLCSNVQPVHNQCANRAWGAGPGLGPAVSVAPLMGDVALHHRTNKCTVRLSWFSACPQLHLAVRQGVVCDNPPLLRRSDGPHCALLWPRHTALLCPRLLHSGSSISQDSQALMLVDMASPKWSIYLVNDAWQKVTGISQELAVGSHFWDLFEPPLPAQVRARPLCSSDMQCGTASEVLHSRLQAVVCNRRVASQRAVALALFSL